MDIEMAQALASDTQATTHTALQTATTTHTALLGQTVKCLVSGADGTVTGKEGQLMSVYLGPDGRKMAQVKCEDGAFNVDLMTVNATLAQEESYRAAMADVQAVSKEGNEKIRAIVEEYNAKVDDIYKLLALG